MWIQKPGQACPSSGTSLLLGNHFCSLPGRIRARGHYLLAAPGCSFFLMEHFSWDVALPARKVSPGHGARREVDELPCGCGQGCVAGLPHLADPSLPASIHPSRLMCRRDPPRGDSHEGQVPSASLLPNHGSRTQPCCVPGANRVCHPEEAAEGLLPDFTSTRGTSLVRASVSLFVHVLAASPGHRRVPAAPGPGSPSEPPGLRPPRPRALGASAAFSPYINKNFTARWQEMHFQFICCSY